MRSPALSEKPSRRGRGRRLSLPRRGHGARGSGASFPGPPVRDSRVFRRHRRKRRVQSPSWPAGRPCQAGPLPLAGPQGCTWSHLGTSAPPRATPPGGAKTITYARISGSISVIRHTFVPAPKTPSDGQPAAAPRARLRRRLGPDVGPHVSANVGIAASSGDGRIRRSGGVQESLLEAATGVEPVIKVLQTCLGGAGRYSAGRDCAARFGFLVTVQSVRAGSG